MRDIEKINRFLLHQWNGNVPVNTEALCKKAGYRVQQGTLEDGVACTMQMQAGVPVMTLSLCLDAPRQRYALAHALGHCLLGHTDGKPSWVDRFDDYARQHRDSLEREANTAALQILMPKKALEYVLEHKQRDYPTPKDIAGLFGVSQLALVQRLTDLGILK